jgi:Transposase DDE domain
MFLPDVFKRFTERSPLSVMAQGAIEYALSESALNQVFEDTAEDQYTRTLLFSTVFDLMSVVVTGSYDSVCSAYKDLKESIPVSLTSVYNKLQGIEPTISAEMVRYTAGRLLPVQRQIHGMHPPWVPGYHVRILDGNHLAATEHRLKETRDQAAAPLPGEALVLFDPEADLTTDVLLEEDGHAQERSLLDDVVGRLNARDLVVADRNMCVRKFLLGIMAQGGFFAIREHAQVQWESAGKLKRLGRTEGGRLREQRVSIRDEKGELVYLRRVVVDLDEPTRDGDTYIAVLCNLPEEDADAKEVAKLYRRRWTIEHAFEDLALALECEINTLCYPKAGLFGFCVGLVVYNLMGVVKGALRGVHGEAQAEQMSAYYMADEMGGVYRGMMIAIPESEWQVFAQMSAEDFACVLMQLAKKINLERFRKHSRGPKKSKEKRHYDPRHPHVSVARILHRRKLLNV